MSDDAREQDRTIALGVAVTIADAMPNLAKLVRSRSAAMSRALWPRGAPRVVTWRSVLDAQGAKLERSMHDVVRMDMETRGSARPETLVRMRTTTEILERIQKAELDNGLDGILALSAPVERRALGDLLDVSLAIVMKTVNTIVERDGRAGSVLLAKMALDLLQEALRGMHFALDAAGRNAEHDAIGAMIEALGELSKGITSLPTSGEVPEPILPGEPVSAPAPAVESDPFATTLSTEAMVSGIERMAAAVTQSAGAVARGIERKLFVGVVPERVSWAMVHEALGDHFGRDTGATGGASAIESCDALLVPDDDEPFSIEQLTEATGRSLAGAAAKLRELPDAERDEAATPVYLQAKLIALCFMLPAQIVGEQLRVATIATQLGFDPVPLPSQVVAVGTA